MSDPRSERLGRRSFTAAVGTALAIGLAGCADDNGNDDDADDGNGDDGADDGADGDALEGGTEIVLDGYSTHWEGVEPGEIDGEENPTLTLQEGESYTIEWTNADDVLHDLQIWDGDDEVVDDLISDEVEEEGESATLEFEASEGMESYVCSYHQTQQVGEIDVQ